MYPMARTTTPNAKAGGRVAIAKPNSVVNAYDMAARRVMTGYTDQSVDTAAITGRMLTGQQRLSIRKALGDMASTAKRYRVGGENEQLAGEMCRAFRRPSPDRS